MKGIETPGIEPIETTEPSLPLVDRGAGDPAGMP
jgi:hypothetical protein